MTLNNSQLWDVCKCGAYRSEHEEGAVHQFDYDEKINESFRATYKPHEFVNEPGKETCGKCDFKKDTIVHLQASGKETYRKPIYARFDLIPPIALHRLAKIYEEGARVYGDSKYITKPMAHSNVVNHLINHLNLAQCGDRLEDHWAKIAWAAFTMMVYEDLGIGEADLTKYGVLPKQETIYPKQQNTIQVGSTVEFPDMNPKP